MKEQLKEIVNTYLEDMEGNKIHPHNPDNVGEARLYFDAGSMIDDIQNMLEEKYPDVEIITIRELFRG